MGLLEFLFGKPKRRKANASRKREQDAESRHQQRLAEQLRRADERRMVREQLAWEARRERERKSAARREEREHNAASRRAKREREASAAHAQAEYRHEHAGEPRPPANERLEKARKLAKAHGGTVEGWEEIFRRTGVNPAVLGINPSRRRERMQAACGGLCIRNPSAHDWSAQFHGTPTNTKDGKVVVGTLENVRYRTPSGSSRAGVLWDHQVLDRGVLRPRAKRKPLLVADPNSGRVSISGGDMRFRPSHGLVG